MLFTLLAITSALSPVFLFNYVFYASIIALILGFGCFIGTAVVYKKPFAAVRYKIPYPSLVNGFKQIALLYTGQLALLFFSIFLFSFLEKQTQCNARLHGLETGYILQLLQARPIGLGWLPWGMYSILGGGLAYFSVGLGRKPFLSRAVAVTKRSTAGFFFHNVISISTEVVAILPYVLVTSFALVWLCESMAAIGSFDSFFVTPFRSVFIYALIIVVLQKSNKQLIDWMQHAHISVGKMLLIYIIAFAFFMIWLHGCSDWIILGKEATTANVVAKSPLAGTYTLEILNTRLSLLIWGWWGIWTPWMLSLVARTAVGLGIKQAVLQAFLLPTVLFSWLLPQLSGESMKWMVTTTTVCLQRPFIQWVILLAVLLFIWVAWGRQKYLGDVLRGAMLPLGRLSIRPLNRWMMIVVLWLSCYIPGWFMLGWLPLQVIVTLGGLFMLLAAAIFIVAWGLTLLSTAFKHQSYSVFRS